MRTGRQTDGYDEASRRFSQFCEKRLKYKMLITQFIMQYAGQTPPPPPKGLRISKPSDSYVIMGSPTCGKWQVGPTETWTSSIAISHDIFVHVKGIQVTRSLTSQRMRQVEDFCVCRDRKWQTCLCLLHEVSKSLQSFQLNYYFKRTRSLNSAFLHWTILGDASNLFTFSLRRARLT
jgi:hypothetical protein